MSDKAQQVHSVFANLSTLLPDLESVYKDIHSHPELSMQENRTAGIAADRLKAAGYEVTTRVGQTGVVGLLRNGNGPTVMLRRASGSGSHGSTVCQQANGDRQYRKNRTRNACLRPRHACNLAHRCGNTAGRKSRRLARYANACFSTRGGNRCGCAGDD